MKFCKRVMCFSAKGLCVSAKEPCMSATEPYIDFYFCKRRALYMFPITRHVLSQKNPVFSGKMVAPELDQLVFMQISWTTRVCWIIWSSLHSRWRGTHPHVTVVCALLILRETTWMRGGGQKSRNCVRYQTIDIYTTTRLCGCIYSADYAILPVAVSDTLSNLWNFIRTHSSLGPILGRGRFKLEKGRGMQRLVWCAARAYSITFAHTKNISVFA